MPKIDLLPNETAELIAAGEVIEKPASIVKELLENAIDSGAEKITVEIKNGGISYIRITDDGCGISYADVPTAFLRHATSKVKTSDDLTAIFTLGFRGEALASVAAVSKVEIFTKEKTSDFGTHYIIEGDKSGTIEQCGCPDGTSIIVRDIFYNVPARLKFLSKNTSEGNAVASIVQKVALSHPEISFSFIRENRREILTPGVKQGESPSDTLYNTMYAVLGKQFAASTLKVEYALNNVKIYGFIVKPLFGKNTRSLQSFFVNGRYIKAFVCNRALEEAYKNSIMTGKFPACVLMLTIDPSFMDVNVHPAKLEVRFSNEKLIFDAIYAAVKNTLLNDITPQPLSVDFQSKNIARIPQNFSENTYNSDKLFPQTTIILTPKSDVSEIPEDLNTYFKTSEPFRITEIPDSVNNSTPNSDIINKLPHENSDTFKYLSEKAFEKPAEAKTFNDTLVVLRIVGEVFGTYIIAERDDEIFLIDKHAAHERILYESLKSGDTKLACQYSFYEEQFNLPPELIDTARFEKTVILGFGFDYMIEGSLCTLTGIPSVLDEQDAKDVFFEVLENLSEFKQNPMPVSLDNIYHTISCKAAIKARDITSIPEMRAIAVRVLDDNDIRYCPHGRPVVFSVAKRELEKNFRRA
ncbi:MAG: DNA mismatch repair endonuclease MutL [Ruminococcus sp.]|nr:DNA mismatch repair endonuclease MutL [Ruminococcus sp.]